MNVSKDAAKLFPPNRGDFSPWEISELIVRRHNDGKAKRKNSAFRPLELKSVRVYVGRPNPEEDHNPLASARSEQRFNQWRSMSDGRLHVVAPLLQYPCEWHAFQREREGAVEKEVDTAIAVDMVRMAADGELEVAILFSADTDLWHPVYEITDRFGGRGIPRVDLAGWSGKSQGKTVKTFLKCPKHPELNEPDRLHLLRQEDYREVADSSDYTPPEVTTMGAALQDAFERR